VLSRSRAPRMAPATGARRSDQVVWHEVECGRYRADLPLWRSLAEETAAEQRSARILEIGAGTGRVALELARAGHRVTALDLDPDLLARLREGAAGVRLETVCDDARAFSLHEHDFDLCIVPMQTVQLLAISAERVAIVSIASAHLAPVVLLSSAN